MNKLFENVEGNKFKLISESVEEQEPKSSLVRKGLKKVLLGGEKEYSYKRLEGVGLGYIRSVSEAKKCALQEARELALEFGYKDKEEEQKFVKELGGNPEDVTKPEEAKEVQIGKKIQNYTKTLMSGKFFQGVKDRTKLVEILQEIQILAEELIKMHGQR